MSNEKAIAEKFGLLICDDLSAFELVRDRVSIVPYLFAKQKKILPIEQNEKGVKVAVADPLDLDSLEELRLLLKKSVQTVYCPKESLESAIERCYHQKEEDAKRLFIDLEKKMAPLKKTGILKAMISSNRPIKIRSFGWSIRF